MIKNFDDNVCRLVEMGHSQVLDYPWGLYLQAIKQKK